MNFAPQHNYELFDAETSAGRLALAKNATADEKFDRFSELRLIASLGTQPPLTTRDRGERWLKEKLPLRMTFLASVVHSGHAK